MYSLFCVALCIACVSVMCTVLLPLGGYPIALNKYIISYPTDRVQVIIWSQTDVFKYRQEIFFLTEGVP